MLDKEIDLIIQRIERWYARLPSMFIYDERILNAQFGWSKEPIKFENRLSLEYKSIVEGDCWGQKWESAWFHLQGDVPIDWVGKTVAANLDFSGEGLVYNHDGEILQGITNASIWDPNFARTRVELIKSSIGSEHVELWVETAANSLFGVFTENDPEKDSPKRHGWFDAKMEKARIGIFDVDLWYLYLDVRILWGLVKRLDGTSIRRSRAIWALNDCINQFCDDRNNAKGARDCLKKELQKPSSASDLMVSAIGHAHIDTGWLWPVRETIRKSARTFATQLRIIDKYPDYIFGASQPQHYQFIKEHYPQIYEKIKKAVKSGNWEVQGGMWVEADCNLISGESMVRQLLYGKNFFKTEFDIEVDNLWLPDVFGYSAALPQILEKAGVNYFLTQKLSWSQFNDFPHHTFIWRGIDGTEVLTHFPPENTYNSELDTEFLLPAQTSFKEKDKLDEFISLFGVGNGGGGPKPENIELGRRMSNLETSPRVKFDTAKNFFKRLNKRRGYLETWVGELYLELHRGTLTTHGLVKKQNRKLEWKLRSVEMLWSFVALREYPAEELEYIWKKLLINQFHDIIPGSSINLVYQTTHKEYEEAHKRSDILLNKVTNILFDKDPDSFVLVNTLSYQWKGAVKIPESFHGYELIDQNQKPVQLQKTDDNVLAAVNLDPISIRTFKKGKKQLLECKNSDNLILENDLIRYEFDSKGALISAYDKEIGKEFLIDSGNILSLYEDRPNNWDAWDIDFFYRDALIEIGAVTKVSQINDGNVISKIEFCYSIGVSKIDQVISIQPHSKRIDFDTSVLWGEKHKMLRVHFPINIKSDYASFDIQYGYVKRNTHRNTSWDKAKFEVVGHKYADLSDYDSGVSLMNDCKYGYMVYDNILDLNLLRSPSNPDPDADQGAHTFTYSLFPHNNDLIRSDVISESNCLNQEPILFEGFKSDFKVPLKVIGDGLELSVIKKAERLDQLIIRIVETHGKKSTGIIQFSGEIIECDLLEWNDIGKKIKIEKEYIISLSAFEIRTYRLKS